MSRIEKEFLAEECGVDESEVYNSYPIDEHHQNYLATNMYAREMNQDKPMPKKCWTCISAIDPHLNTPIFDVPMEYDFICEYTRDETSWNGSCDKYRPCPQMQNDFNAGCHS